LDPQSWSFWIRIRIPTADADPDVEKLQVYFNKSIFNIVKYVLYGIKKKQI